MLFQRQESQTDLRLKQRRIPLASSVALAWLPVFVQLLHSTQGVICQRWHILRSTRSGMLQRQEHRQLRSGWGKQKGKYNF